MDPSESMAMGVGMERKGEPGRRGRGPNDSIPGSRTLDCCEGAAMGRGAAGDWNWEGVTTLLSRLLPVLYSRVSGCHVRRRQASSALLDMDSRRDQPGPPAVGEDSRLLLPEGEKTAELGELMDPGAKR